MQYSPRCLIELKSCGSKTPLPCFALSVWFVLFCHLRQTESSPILPFMGLGQVIGSLEGTPLLF